LMGPPPPLPPSPLSLTTPRPRAPRRPRPRPPRRPPPAPPRRAPHDAGADALASLELVRALGRRFAARLERLTPAELHTLQMTWHAAQARGLQAWFTRSGTPETVSQDWPLRPELPTAA
ncbi:3'-5' exonuclease, partial [Streptomyces sp900105755]